MFAGVRRPRLEAPRPWHVRYVEGHGHEIVAADDTIVQTGFDSLWDALMWARDK